MKKEQHDGRRPVERAGLLPGGAVWCLLALLVLLAGCRSSRQAEGTSLRQTYLSSKVKLTIPNKGGTMTVNGTMRLKSGERMQLSLLMPILRTEVVRLDVTPDEVILIDRMGKRYVQATRKELKPFLPRKFDFAHLEKLLYAASLPGGKSALTAGELGLAGLDKARIELYGFSDKEFELTPTQVSSKYNRVELPELIELLSKMKL